MSRSAEGLEVVIDANGLTTIANPYSLVQTYEDHRKELGLLGDVLHISPSF